MLLQKFDDLKSHIVEEKLSAKSSLTILKASTLFEDYLITLVKYFSQKKWKMTPHGATKLHSPNLLFLATALNLSGLIHVLFQWVDANHVNADYLSKEADCAFQEAATSGFTPLVSLFS